MGEVLSGIGDLVFSLVIGYLGALEFLYVVRHLYHWSFRHAKRNAADDVDELQTLQQQMRCQLTDSDVKEALAGTNVMKDGVMYKDGFRIDAQQDEIDRLIQEQRDRVDKAERRKEIEAELARQRKIEQETRKQLEEAEATLAQRQKEEELKAAERQSQKEKENEKAIEAEEETIPRENELHNRTTENNEKKLIEAEEQLERVQRRIKEDEQEASEQQEENQKTLDVQVREKEDEWEFIENERKLLETEKQREAEQQFTEEEAEEKEAIENENKMFDTEKRREAVQKWHEENQFESAGENQSTPAITQHQQKPTISTDKQARINDNAKKFLAAEREMIDLQQKMMEVVQERQIAAGLESEPQTPVVEELCIKKIIAPKVAEAAVEIESERPIQRVKTQFGQTSDDAYNLTGKPLNSSQSTDAMVTIQLSEEAITGEDGASKSTNIQFPQTERQEPEGEDNAPSAQYTDDYLRSLDGIKQRPLIREDGSGRRRAFKKRRSSGSSNSSRDSRTSREEEVKMFTSLEEEEMQSMKKGEAEYTPIKYTNEPTLKVKGHHRRHKRSPAIDIRIEDENNSVKGSLEMLNEENSDPWGEVVPEHYKDTEFWKREKAMSIDEEEIEVDDSKHDLEKKDAIGSNTLKASSFEDANQEQNEAAISVLQKQFSTTLDENDAPKTVTNNGAEGDTNAHLQTSQNVEEVTASAHSPASSPRLRRSPRIDEIDQYDKNWKESTETTTTDSLPSEVSTPTISIIQADNAPWRDEHGLIMEGLSDFYDFTASINTSRSRSASRNPSPINSPPSSPMLKNISYKRIAATFHKTPEATETTESSATMDIYDDTHNNEEIDIESVDVSDLVKSLQNSTRQQAAELAIANTQDKCDLKESCEQLELQNYTEDDVSEKFRIMAVPSVLINSLSEDQTTTIDSPTKMNELIEMLRSERSRSVSSRSRSRSPLPSSSNIERSLESRKNKLIKQNDAIFEKLFNPSPSTERISTVERSSYINNKDDDENVCDVFETLCSERTKSRSRSRSLSPDNTESNLTTPLNQHIIHNDEKFNQLANIQSTSDSNTPDMPKISVEYVEADFSAANEDIECSRENMTTLVESLRKARSRSRSKSPMRLPTGENLAHSLAARRKKLIERSDAISDQFIITVDAHHSRSHSPSRSLSNSPNRKSDEVSFINVLDDNLDFNTFLNLEGSHNKTLVKHTEEVESYLAEKQRLVDDEALKKLKTAYEETELRTLTPTDLKLLPEQLDHMRQLRCTPTTPDYDRSISEEWSDIQRIKNELLTSGFKRSTYVGESLELGHEFEPLRFEAAIFRRSQGPSRSIVELDAGEIQMSAVEKRELQEQILSELISSTDNETNVSNNGTKPKTTRKYATDYDRTFSAETRDTERIRDELIRRDFKRSTYVGESVDLSPQFEDLRRETAEFRRSTSRSRSPLDEHEKQEIAEIQKEAERRELQDKLLDELDVNNANFQDFSRHLNVDFLESERRASDSALIQRPELLIQLQDDNTDLILDPDDYHHFRRFSLNQEQPVDEYPSDDYVFVSQIKVRTPTGTRTWLQEDYYSDSADDSNSSMPDMDISDIVSAEAMCTEGGEEEEGEVQAREDEYTDGSEDERQTVVEVEDEIDEDISDFNERGPNDESHHEQSECEEAEREMDQYADREASDWIQAEDVNQSVCLDEDQTAESAAGTLESINSFAYDDDSAAIIDQLYDEAIKHRKQSGILRDYDSIVRDMQDGDVENFNKNNGAQDSGKKRSIRSNRGVESCVSFLEHERQDHEMRYLGDAEMSARQSARLRSRYGYMPLLQGNAIEDIKVDLTYKPKREYNWRKNFKLDDEEDELNEKSADNSNDVSHEGGQDEQKQTEGTYAQILDLRKYSLGGESVTLFSRSPEKEKQKQQNSIDAEMSNQDIEQPTTMDDTQGLIDQHKKRKTKKKLRRGSKVQSGTRDKEESENQIDSRRNSNCAIEGMDSPNHKIQSRRSSKSSQTNEELVGLPSPMGSVDFEDNYGKANEQYAAAAIAPNKKKIKKRKKAKEGFSPEAKIKEENIAEPILGETKETKEIVNAYTYAVEVGEMVGEAANQTADDKTSDNAILADMSVSLLGTVAAATNVTATTTATANPNNPNPNTSRTVDSFDIIKDASFYPLF